MEEAGSKFINFAKIKRRSWKNLEASKDSSFFLAYPIEASENSIRRWILELRSLEIRINEMYPIDGISEPLLLKEKE